MSGVIACGCGWSVGRVGCFASSVFCPLRAPALSGDVVADEAVGDVAVVFVNEGHPDRPEGGGHRRRLVAVFLDQRLPGPPDQITDRPRGRVNGLVDRRPVSGD